MAELSSNNSRNLFLYGDVEDTSVRPLLEAIIKFNDEDDLAEEKEKNFERKPIKLVVNTPGGVMNEGFALITAIELSKTPVHVYVYGRAMSMGLPIVTAGHKRYASRFARFMYHQPSGGAIGKINDMQQSVDESKQLEKMYDEYMLSKTEIRQVDLEPVKLSRGEWFFSADEAKKMGIIDEVI